MTKEGPSKGNDPKHKMLGQIFVERGLLTEVSVQRMVASAKSADTRFGTYLEQIGLVTPEELADALAIQYHCRKIRNFARFEFDPQLLRMIPIGMAVENTIFPLKLENGKLGLAVIDPTTDKLFEEIATQHGVKLAIFVSTRTDVNRAIAKHYMGREVPDSEEKTILLVEDDELIRTAVSDTLTKHRFSVNTAADPIEAFKIIFTHKPMLIITDKIMPKLGGYEFLDAVRKIPEFLHTPVILMTANATPDEELNAFKKGFFDIILKPVKEVSLMRRVKRALDSIDSSYYK
jgi:CheY-like chemotaxis protein